MGSVVQYKKPLDPGDRKITVLDQPLTIREFLDQEGIKEFHQPTICRFNDGLILRKDWPKVTIGENDIVNFIPIAGTSGLSGGGGTQKSPGRFAAFAALFLITAGVGLATGGLAAGLVFAVGSYLINTLIPPPKPTDPSKGWGATNKNQAPSPTYTLNAQGNVARIGQAIPVVYGRHLIYPDFAAEPYQEFKDNEQDLYQLFCIGQGYYDVEDLRIEDTPVSYFPEITWRVVNPGEALEIIRPDVISCAEVAGQELKGINDLKENETGWIGPFTLNPATTKTDNIQIDIIWPSGLFLSDSSGNPSNLTTAWEIRVRAINDSGTVIEGPGIASARGRITFTANPSNGHTVTLNGVAWSFVVAAPAGNQTLIGADLAATLTQLAIDLNNAVNPSLATATYSATATDLVIVHDAVGTSGSSFTLAASNGKVSHATLIGGWTGARGSIHFAANPTTGKTITLNGVTWSFVAAAPAGNQTLIGANLAATLTQLAIDLNNSVDPALTVATYTVVNSDLIITHDTPGLAGQAYTLAATAGTTNGAKLKDGAWSTIGLETYTDDDMTPIRKTYTYPVVEGRFQIQGRRTNNKSNSAFAQDALHWGGARAYLTTAVDFSGLTFIEVKARATNNLSQRTSRQFNAIVTRKLPIWDGQNWSEPQPTRSIAWALADICRAPYGAKLAQSKYDLEWLKNHDPIWEARGDHFDGVFDSVGTVWDALDRVALVGRAKPYEQGGMIRFFRHAPGAIVTAMFTARNIKKGSFNIDYMMPDEDTPDVITGEFFSSETWKPDSVTVSLPDSIAETPARMSFFGITDKQHLYRETWYRANVNRFERIGPSFSTEFEGLLLTYGDLISVTHPLIKKNASSGEIIDYDEAAGILTTSEPVTFTPNQDFRIALRRRDGTLAAPLLVAPGQTAYTVHLLEPIDLNDIEIYTGDQAERTHYAFGPSYDYSRICRVQGIKIHSRTDVMVYTKVEDPRVHLDPPPLP